MVIPYKVKMEIRKYQAKDKSALVSLWERAFPDDPPHNAPSIVIEQKLVVDDLIFIAENDKKIVGACIAGYDGHRGWLYAVAVSRSQRRKGTGTLLIKFAIEALKAIGCNKVNLQIRSTNTAVTNFYKSLGFFIEDRLSMGVFT